MNNPKDGAQLQGRQTAVIAPHSAAPTSYDTHVSEAPKPKKLAVFVAHGMGQQLKYETLDQIAQGLIEAEEAKGRERSDITIEPPVVTIKSDGSVLHGLKLNLLGDDGQDREVHIFEGYWAPLAEGQVRQADVIRFLFTAGLNGVRNFGDRFDRWLFGEYRKYQSRTSLTIFLLIALAVIGSLIVMDSALIFIAAHSIAEYAGLLTDPRWQWISVLKRDLVTTYDIFILLAILFGCALLAGSKAREFAIDARREEIRTKTARIKRRRNALRISRAANLISWALFGLTLGATVLCGVTIPLLFYAHNKRRMIGETFWAKTIGQQTDIWLNDSVSYLFLALLLLWLGWLAVKAIVKFSSAMRFMDKNSVRVLLGTIAVLTLVIVVVFKLAIAVYQSWLGLGQFWIGVILEIRTNISLGLLVAVSMLIRRLLVQYVGDVALYITPHTLDRFNNLRDKIRLYVFDAARAVYACRSTEAGKTDQPQYEGVFIVGHSLGSVIAYDTLNQLLDQDTISDTGGLDVLNRTKLLLTFGSPLDKTAFLFSLQREKTSREREALAAAAQPLIVDPKFRDPGKFEWINVYSHNDIISGRLDFYDPPTHSKTRQLISPIKNIEDQEATTLLAAHVEYWDNQLVFQKLHQKLTERGKVSRKV
jgi:hypothetical protein